MIPPVWFITGKSEVDNGTSGRSAMMAENYSVVEVWNNVDDTSAIAPSGQV